MPADELIKTPSEPPIVGRRVTLAEAREIARSAADAAEQDRQEERERECADQPVMDSCAACGAVQLARVIELGACFRCGYSESAEQNARPKPSYSAIHRMKPRPRMGKVFLEEIDVSDWQSEAGLVLPENANPDTHTRRAEVVDIGPQDPEEPPYDFKRGDHVLVAYYAGRKFQWLDEHAVLNSLWIVTAEEIITVFEQPEEERESG